MIGRALEPGFAMLEEEQTYVLIVGGGPVGLTLALELGLHGIPAMVVNESTNTSTLPKCSYLNIRTMEHLRRLGVAAEIRGERPRPGVALRILYRTQFCGRELASTELRLPTKQRAASPEDPRPYPQSQLEPLLKRHIQERTWVDVRFGWRATEMSVGETCAQATLTEVATGKQQKVRARYLVGCDGQNSAVRALIGAKLVGKDGAVERRFLSGTKMIYYVRCKALQATLQVPPPTLVWAINAHVRGLIMAYDAGDCFIVQYQIPPEVRWEEIRPREVLDKLFGSTTPYEILCSDYWEGGVAKVADRYRDGVAFLAGDAAHIFTPLGGFGMNTGIGDAINLGWKLAAVYEGWATQDILESYEAERQETGIRNSLIGVHAADRKDKWVVPDNLDSNTPEGEAARVEFGRFAVEDDKEEHYTVGLQLGERYASNIIMDASDVAESDPWDRYTPRDDAGARLPHFMLDDSTSLYDALGRDFSLIVFGAIDTAGFEAAAAARKLPLTVLKLAQRDAQFQHDLVLVRPDLHIAWSADEFPDNLYTIIDTVRGATA